MTSQTQAECRGGDAVLLGLTVAEASLSAPEPRPWLSCPCRPWLNDSEHGACVGHVLHPQPSSGPPGGR